MWLHQDALTFEDTDRGTLKESYFSLYIIPIVPHIPSGVRDKVIEVLILKIDAGVYEASQSTYRSHDAELPPILDGFVEPFAGA